MQPIKHFLELDSKIVLQTPAAFLQGPHVYRPFSARLRAKVTLRSQGGQNIAATESDFLGDFEFKGLDAGGEYLLRAEYEGYLAKEITVRTDASVKVGELVLAAK